MQELYDDDDPADHRAPGRASPASCARARSGAPMSSSRRPARNRDDIEEIVKELVARGLDGIMIVMLTYGPAMRTVRALAGEPAPAAARQHPARARRDRRVDDGRPHLQPGHPRGPGPVQRDAARRVPVLGHHRRVALAGVPRRLRVLGEGRADGHEAEADEDRAVRLPDERHGRRPLRRHGAAAQDRADRRQREPRGRLPADAGRHRRRRRGGPEEPRRMVRDRPEASRREPRVRRSASSSPCGGSSRRAATTGGRCTSNPSGGTAVSSSSRCSPPRT